MRDHINLGQADGDSGAAVTPEAAQEAIRVLGSLTAEQVASWRIGGPLSSAKDRLNQLAGETHGARPAGEPLEAKRYRSLVEATTAIVWNTPASGEFESEQPGWSAFTGQDFDQLKGWGWLNAVHPDDRPNTARVWSEAVASRSLYQVEHRLRRHDGAYRHMMVRAVPILDEAGEIREWVGVHTDIDDRKRDEAALKEAKEAAEVSAAWARLVVDTAYDAFVVMDEQGQITDWNRRAETTFGWSRAEALGRSLAETIIPPEFRDRHTQGVRHFLATGEGAVLNRRIEVTALNREGQLFPIELTIRPIRQGQQYVFTAFLHDITARRAAAAALREAKEAAEAASRAKSEFLANMSHEIRTPMNGILGMTELALDTDLTADQREYLEAVKLSADYLLAVINDILDFSKIEAGKLDLDPVDFRLRDHLDETVTTLALRAHSKGLELACQVLDDVPDDLVGDPGRLRQVVVNLIGNAVKFTGQGEVVMRVEVESRTETHARLHFAIRDTGIGIPSSKLGLLFQAFSQVDGSTTRKYGGTGLGLAISSQLVRLMDGRVWVESEEGKGSTFHFTAQFGLSANPLPAPAPTDLSRLKDLRVLVVDDNATNRRILHGVLTQWGMRPTSVEDGPQALAAMRLAADAGEPFAVVLLDHMMPGMDGLTLAERIQHNPSLAGSVLMMLSSADRREVAARCRERGVNTYLTKPIKRADLLHALAAVRAPAQEPACTPAPRRGVAQCGRGLRLLLAEDNAVNQKLAVRLLEKRGHTVVVAANGKEALAALEAAPFDAVLMDVMMPEMDGFEATAAIRAREKATGDHVPIVAMTAHAMKGDRERCLEVGMDGYISKPLQPGELFEAVERAVAGGPAAEAPSATPSEDAASYTK
ncbi:MAG: response regulator [Gemmataceae bacterium]